MGESISRSPFSSRILFISLITHLVGLHSNNLDFDFFRPWKLIMLYLAGLARGDSWRRLSKLKIQNKSMLIWNIIFWRRLQASNKKWKACWGAIYTIIRFRRNSLIYQYSYFLLVVLCSAFDMFIKWLPLPPFLNSRSSFISHIPLRTHLKSNSYTLHFHFLHLSHPFHYSRPIHPHRSFKQSSCLFHTISLVPLSRETSSTWSPIMRKE